MRLNSIAVIKYLTAFFLRKRGFFITKMVAAKFFLGLIFLTICLLLPFNFERIVFFLVEHLGFGWVLSTIFIRFLVILSFALVLKIIASFNTRFRTIKFWLIFLIAIIPGFGISFISPIYRSDYGLVNDNFKLDNPKQLNYCFDQDNNDLNAGFKLYVFFTTTCPHCMMASEKLGINLATGQKVPIFAIFPGNDGDPKKFISDHNGANFNSCELNNDSLFLALTGASFPSIFLLNDQDSTLYHWTGDEMNYTALDYLLNLEQ